MVPPLIMGSLAWTTTSRPCTSPIPARLPAPWTSPSYIPRAASGAISSQGVPGSRSRSSRSCTVSFPSSALRRRARSDRSERARVSSRRSSSTSPCMASKFRRYSSPLVSTRVSMASMVSPLGAGEQVVGDGHAGHLGGGAAQAEPLGVAPGALGGGAAAVTLAGGDLEAGAGGPLGALGAEHLGAAGHGGRLRVARPPEPGGAVADELGRLGEGQHLGQLEGHLLAREARPAVALVREGVAGGGREDRAHEAGGGHRHRQVRR